MLPYSQHFYMKRETFAKKIKLGNGLRVLIYKMPWAHSVAAQLLIGAGSRFETEDNSGTAHFLEHMFFEGTKSYPSRKKLDKATEAWGGELSAYTGKELVSYSAKFLSQNSNKALEFLYELVFNSLLNEQAIEKEKGIIVQELKRRIDNPEAYRWSLLLKSIWSERHPLGMMNVGNEKSINAVNIHALRDYLNRFYIPSNIILVVAGKLKLKETLNQINKLFGSLSCDKNLLSFMRADIRTVQNKIERVFIENRPNINQVNIIMSFIDKVRNVGRDEIASRALSQLLNNAIFNSLVNEAGIAYSATASQWIFRDHTLQYVLTGVAPEKLSETIKRIVGIINGLEINEETLTEAKNTLKKNTLLNLADTDDFTELFGEQEFYFGKISDTTDLTNRIDEITVKDLIRLKNEIFRYKNCVLALLGPIKEKKELLENALKKIKK